jgi:hypothetical protein
MTTVELIEQKIVQLSNQELAELRRWFAAFDANAWDEQIEADAAAGRLDKFAEEAFKDYETGTAIEI